VALLLWSFVATHMVALVHAATAIHSRCADHGELVDGDEGGRLAHADAHADTASIHSMPGASAEDHDHCQIGCVAHQQSTPAPEPIVAAAPLAQARDSVAPRKPTVAHGPQLYLTAPKTSPPAA
jgi:hypothetical protein